MKKEKTNFILYAIREIFLVVIGILIAVSINNWNENRNQNKELNQILLTVKEDLENDITKIDKVIEFYNNADTVFKGVINSKYSREDYQKNPKIGRLIFGYPELSFTKRGVSLLEKFKGSLTLEKEELVQELIEFYNEQLWEIRVDDELRAKDYKENFSYWKANHDWWFDYVQLNQNEEFINYALESKDYKTRVATAQFFAYKVYLPEIREFKDKGMNIIKKIDILH